jgi:7-cyano-7-deazaguanine synthase
MLEDKLKVVVLLSGGMDSVCALYQSNEKYEVISALSFDYGSKHNHKELPYASYHCKKLNIPHSIIKIDFIDDYFHSCLLKGGEYLHKNCYDNSKEKAIVPFRNGIMLSIAVGYAESRGGKGVVIAAHSGDYSVYPDCREKFLKSMAKAVCDGTYNKMKIIRPFVFMTKEQIVRKGRALDIDFSKTWSCNEGVDIHCGECGTCIGRREAFNSARVADPTDYSSKKPLPLSPID